MAILHWQSRQLRRNCERIEEDSRSRGTGRWWDENGATEARHRAILKHPSRKKQLSEKIITSDYSMIYSLIISFVCATNATNQGIFKLSRGFGPSVGRASARGTKRNIFQALASIRDGCRRD
jgi:hypothetical protein